MTDPRPAVHAEPGIRVLFTAPQILERVREMGLELARGLSGKNPLYVGVLKGACLFQADLARATPLDLEMDFLAVASYGAGTTSSGNVQLIMDLRSDIRGRHVVLCEGVVDSGRSVKFILDLLEWVGPKSRPYADMLEAWRTSVPASSGVGRRQRPRFRYAPPRSRTRRAHLGADRRCRTPANAPPSPSAFAQRSRLKRRGGPETTRGPRAAIDRTDRDVPALMDFAPDQSRSGLRSEPRHIPEECP